MNPKTTSTTTNTMSTTTVTTKMLNERNERNNDDGCVFNGCWKYYRFLIIFSLHISLFIRLSGFTLYP